MTARRNTLYLGSSHLVPVEMVEPPFRFRYHGRWQVTQRRRILASDLPRGTLDVYGGRTARETFQQYQAISSSTASWREFHPFTYSHAIILLGGNDLVELYEEYQANPSTPRKDLITPIKDPIRFRTIALDIARTLLRIRQFLQRFIPKVLICTLIPRRAQPVQINRATRLINRRLLRSLSSQDIIPLHRHLTRHHLCRDGIHTNRHGADILTSLLQA